MICRSTTDVTFIARQLQDKYLGRKRKLPYTVLYFMFVDLEKALDKVPHEVIRRAMRKLGVMKWLVWVVNVTVQGLKNLCQGKWSGG